MTPLVELYDEANLQRVFGIGATLIRINNRNLHTMQTDLDHTLRLRDKIPPQCLLVAESGIKTHADVQRLPDAGVDAILVGESLMRQADLGPRGRSTAGKRIEERMKYAVLISTFLRRTS